MDKSRFNFLVNSNKPRFEVLFYVISSKRRIRTHFQALLKQLHGSFTFTTTQGAFVDSYIEEFIENSTIDFNKAWDDDQCISPYLQNIWLEDKEEGANEYSTFKGIMGLSAPARDMLKTSKILYEKHNHSRTVQFENDIELWRYINVPSVVVQKLMQAQRLLDEIKLLIT